MKILLTALLLTLSFSASAYDNYSWRDLQQQNNQQQIIREMQNMRREQERENRQREMEYNNYQWQQQQNRTRQIIQQLNQPQFYPIQPIRPFQQ